MLIPLRKIIKYSLFSLIPLLIIFLSLEVTQRIRYSIKQKNRAWLFYGLRKDSEKSDINNKYIKISEIDVDTFLNKAFNDLRLPYDINNRNYEYIVCVGGSSTAGVFNEPEHRYPYLLNQLVNSSLSSSNHIKYIIVNMGMAGRSSDSYYKPLKRILEKISPKLIIFYCGYNDIFIKDVNKIYATVSAKLGSFYNFLERYSLLLVTLKEKFLINQSNQTKSYERNSVRYKELENEFYKNIDSCVDLSVSKNIKVILMPEVLMARNFGEMTTNYEDYSDKYSNIPVILNKIAKKYNCEFIDLHNYFDSNDFKKYFIDPVHLTSEGNNILSKLILQKSKTLKELTN
ncbi:MAG: hypothetical protein DRP74_00210 [Candidatus Omnitrophota bacterium]|nr:MAG: hypothetical protein DRP74_00210 [Candidatus Omnitrophota bacterium]